MDCACIDMDYDGEPAQFYSAREVTSRKKHICFECGRYIVKGEKYEYAVGKWEKEFNNFKTCSDCVSVRNAFFCGAVPHGCIWDELDGYLVPGQCLDKAMLAITEGAREKILRLIDIDE